MLHGIAPALTEVTEIDVPVETYLRTAGGVFRTFPHQDSGTTSYGVFVDGERWFVKPSTDLSIVESLRRALRLNSVVQHPALPRLHNSFSIPDGMALVSLPVEEILAALDTVFDAHVLMAERGFVASDFYDGCIIYDFEAHRIYLCDLDEYREGPFALDMDRAYGSTRFMAPEEFQRGAVIDQVTNVFNLGRASSVLLGDGTGGLDAWRGTDAMRRVIERATLADRTLRHQSVEEFVGAWRSAVTGSV